jgi:starch synthase
LRRYAWECQTQEGGWGLDAVLRDHSWKLRGIVNGIDYSEWNPAHDGFLRSDGYANFDTQTLREGKAACKAALQRVRVEVGKPLLQTSTKFPFCFMHRRRLLFDRKISLNLLI